jgi:hypothetical protein
MAPFPSDVRNQYSSSSLSHADDVEGFDAHAEEGIDSIACKIDSFSYKPLHDHGPIHTSDDHDPTGDDSLIFATKNASEVAHDGGQASPTTEDSNAACCASICEVQHRDQEESPSPLRPTSTKSITAFTILRDLFFSAFADGNSYCCGDEGIFPRTNNEDCCNIQFSGHGKVAPTLAAAPSNGSASSSQRGDSSTYDTRKPLPSQSPLHGASANTMPRKKPLAVAVGFKYAEDFEGRPVIVRSGNPGLKPGCRPLTNGSPLSRPWSNT